MCTVPNARRAEARTRERRQRLAYEAARLMAEGGYRDYQAARLKAAERLGIRDEPSMPRNREIEDALRERQRLFHADGAEAVRVRREAALEAMAFFEAFHPRLAGPVLDGTVDRHAPVTLHLHVDDPGDVARFLADAGIPGNPRWRRPDGDRTRPPDIPVWSFDADGIGFELVVLPMAMLRQPPRAGPGEPPIERATRSQLAALVAVPMAR
jgi:hypothetical protein